MKWEKKGLIYKAPLDNSWMDNSALTPTPLLKNSAIIRVYAGFRDKKGISRIGYVDLASDDPSVVKGVSTKPVLDIGQDGMFDDNGVILGDIVRIENKLYMYYVGFQIVNKVKFLAYSGLAISSDNGDTFQKYSQTPILDRNDEGLYIRAIHSVIYDEGKFKIWYATGNGWEYIGGNHFPQYDINYIESTDGKSIFGSGHKCITNNPENNEYRIGRPRVIKRNDQYIMTFTYGTTDGRYIAGCATSLDGINWNRADEGLGIELSKDGWDSMHLCYPAILSVNDDTYMFYNGNNMGVDGFGYAKLISKEM